MRDVHVAAALVLRDDQVLLIRQKNTRDSREFWTLPAGKVEKNELMADALKRELKEETGLDLAGPVHLIHCAQTISELRQISWLTFTFLLTQATGEICPNDPDGLILEAKFFPRAEAMRLIGEYQPLRVMREPVLAYLADPQNAGSFWSYRVDQRGEEVLVQRILPAREA